MFDATKLKALLSFADYNHLLAFEVKRSIIKLKCLGCELGKVFRPYVVGCQELKFNSRM